MEHIGRHFIITGRVQGVCFRDNTRTKALELGITGWVRNSSQGHVECRAYGTQEQLDHLEAWLWQGPRKAEVSAVNCEPIPYEVYSGFDIRYQA
jgi:acylphosphatase